MLEVLHAQLDEAAFDEAWEQGAKLSLEEAIARALGETSEDRGLDEGRS